MLKSTVLEVLKTFSPDECKKFNDFLSSPYFNKINNVVKLYSEISKYKPDYESDELMKENLWKKIFPEKEYNYGIMKNIIHELSKLSEKFIMTEIYEKKDIQKFSNLYEGLFSRKLFRILDSKDSLLESKFNDRVINKYGSDLPVHYFYMSRIYMLKMWKNHFLDMKINNLNDRTQVADNYVCSIIMYLINIYATTIAYETNDKINTPNFNITEQILTGIPEKTFETVFDQIRKNSEIKYELLNLYYHGFRSILKKGSSEDYFKFKENLFNVSEILTDTSLRNLATMLDNSLYFINDPNIDKKTELYETLQFKLSKNIFLQNNEEIADGVFIYWSKIFFSENKPDEFEDFIKKYGNCINESSKENTLYLVNAQLYFMRSNFDKASEELSKANFDVFELKIVLKILQMMICYEQNNYESFLNLYDSSKHFLKNIKLAESDLRNKQKKRAKEFFDGMHKLFKIKISFDSFNLNKLREEVIKNNFDHSKWFLKKIGDLKAGEI